MDKAHKLTDLREENCVSEDWICIETEIEENEKKLLAFLALMDRVVNTYCVFEFTKFKYWFGWAKARKEKRVVYMLTSFIEAHEHAQKKIHDFVGETDDDELLIPEEMHVIAESRGAVNRAREILANIDNDQVKGIQLKQATRNILAKQTQFVVGMVGEGLLTSKDAQAFYEEINLDIKKIEESRKKMYREQSKKAGNDLRQTTVSGKLDVSSISNSMNINTTMDKG